jgi:hypothetical protein
MQHAKVVQKLKEEMATLEGMVGSHNELIMEITNEIGLNRNGEDADDKENDSDKEDDDEEDDDDDGGDTVAPPAAAPPPVSAPPATTREVIIVEEVEEDPAKMIPKQEAPEA